MVPVHALAKWLWEGMLPSQTQSQLLSWEHANSRTHRCP